jgi:ribosome-binding factor A
LRTEVGKGTGVKFTPTLEFVLDAIPENAAHVEDLLRAAAEDDARVHQQAETATYAGEPNPYRESDD